MANITLFLVVFFAKILVMNSQKNCGYYWKLYYGTIPKDAVEGGKLSNGEVLYIASVYLKLADDMLPSMIIPSKNSVQIGWYGIVMDVKNSLLTEVKILCSRDKEGFEWIPTNTVNLHTLTKRNLVSGGFLLGHELYIGRMQYDGGDAVGKVFSRAHFFQGLYISPHVRSKSFEVLAYNCKKEKDGDKKSTSDRDRLIEDIFKGL